MRENMDIPQIKRLAAQIMKCGVSRIRIVDVTEAAQAMTKDDVRGLIKRNVVVRIQKKGVSRVRAKKIAIQKKKGRRRGKGSRKGAKKARTPKKRVWITKVRALRISLGKTKEKLNTGAYRKLYNMIKGGYFRTKDHLKNYIEEKKLRLK